MANPGVERETCEVEPLLAGARNPPRPPDPPAPPTTGWAGRSSGNPKRAVSISPRPRRRRLVFFCELVAELKQVTWPAPLLTVNNSRVVLGVVAFVGAGLAAIDIASGHAIASFIR